MVSNEGILFPSGYILAALYKFAVFKQLFLNAIIGLLTGFFTASVAAQAVPSAPQRLFQISARDTNIFAFTLDLEEIKREHRSSVVRATGFHGRPSASTRWMMCMLNTLAIQRGFEFWTVVYPDHPSEELLIGFLEFRQEKISEKDPRFATKQAIPLVVPVERGVQFCKSYRQELQGKG
jgi:hypothetical protein